LVAAWTEWNQGHVDPLWFPNDAAAGKENKKKKMR
jgi:hypothetical protein